MLKILSIGLWALLSIATLLILTVPVSVEAHLLESIAVIAILALLKSFDRLAKARALFLALGTALILQYAIWRITSTLPSPADLQNFIPALILLAAEMYCILMFAMSTFVIAAPLQRRAAPKLNDAEAPTVDVLVPTYNESSDIVAVTLVAAKAMTYPADKLNVYLLDDGGTDEKCDSDDETTAHEARHRRASLQELCAELGVRYLTREQNVHAKAGNLNAALQHVTGELIVVLDADHAPSRDFLQMTVGHFAQDERLFLVQTPHQFINPDPIERNLQTFSTMPSENEMFYGHIQKGLDKWNAAFFCGSAAVLRA
jgi:cellulose synthase (UDP-forming)